MAMSKDHADAVCFQCESFGTVDTRLGRSAVDASEAKPQRAGVTQEKGSSNSRSVTGIMPPASTSCAISVTTISGRTWLLVCASADTQKPRIAATTHVAAISTNNSTMGLPSAAAPDGAGLPILGAVTSKTSSAD